MGRSLRTAPGGVLRKDRLDVALLRAQLEQGIALLVNGARDPRGDLAGIVAVETQRVGSRAAAAFRQLDLGQPDLGQLGLGQLDLSRAGRRGEHLLHPGRRAVGAHPQAPALVQDRTSVTSGKSVSVRVDLGGPRSIKTKRSSIPKTLYAS